MKKIILSKIEYELLIEHLNSSLNYTDNSLAEKKWFDKMGATQHLYELELESYKIKKYGDPSTKTHMLQWLISKIKAKTLDL